MQKIKQLAECFSMSRVNFSMYCKMEETKIHSQAANGFANNKIYLSEIALPAPTRCCT